MSVKQLYLIRHAKTLPNPEVDAADWRLAPSAYTACQALADSLKNAGITRFVTSEEVKARETSRVLAENLDLPCESAPGLHEHDRRGAPFLDVDTFQQTMHRFFEQPDTLVFGLETARKARTRFTAALRMVQNRHPQDTLAVVSHGTVLSLFVAHQNGLDATAFWKNLTMPDVVVLSAGTYLLSPTEPG